MSLNQKFSNFEISNHIDCSTSKCVYIAKLSLSVKQPIEGCDTKRNTYHSMWLEVASAVIIMLYVTVGKPEFKLDTKLNQA